MFWVGAGGLFQRLRNQVNAFVEAVLIIMVLKGNSEN